MPWPERLQTLTSDHQKRKLRPNVAEFLLAYDTGSLNFAENFRHSVSGVTKSQHERLNWFYLRMAVPSSHGLQGRHPKEWKGVEQEGGLSTRHDLTTGILESLLLRALRC